MKTHWFPLIRPAIRAGYFLGWRRGAPLGSHDLNTARFFPLCSTLYFSGTVSVKYLVKCKTLLDTRRWIIQDTKHAQNLSIFCWDITHAIHGWILARGLKSWLQKHPYHQALHSAVALQHIQHCVRVSVCKEATEVSRHVKSPPVHPTQPSITNACDDKHVLVGSCHHLQRHCKGKLLHKEFTFHFQSSLGLTNTSRHAFFCRKTVSGPKYFCSSYVNLHWDSSGRIRTVTIDVFFS